MGIAALDAISDRPFTVRHGGAVFTLPDPRALTHAQITAHVETDGRFLLPAGRMPFWKAEALLERWLAHHGLGTPRDIARLSYLVERYESHLAYDLQCIGVNLEAEWQSRRWRRLLQIVDHLPSHTYYQHAAANDPEHAAMIVKAQEAHRQLAEDQDAPSGPPLTFWTPEVAAIADLIDATQGVKHAIIMSNSDPKSSPPKPPPPYRRPVTLLSGEAKKAAHQRRKAAHEALAARMLPHKARLER